MTHDPHLHQVVVTGARGAIGRHVVGRARTRGGTVSGLGHGAWAGDPDLPPIDRWINGGVDADTLSASIGPSGAPDAIVHLAGGANVGASIAHPGEDFRRTVESGQRLLEWMRSHAPRARLVIASSAAVYGDRHDGRIPEDARLDPISPYGTHKAVLEMMATCYARQYGLSIAIVRLFSVYGPGLRKQLVWEVCRRLLGGETELVLGGTGGEVRDFVFIEDAAEILLDALLLASPAAPVFNGSSGGVVTTRALADTILAHFPGARVRFSGATRPGDPRCLVGDPAAARQARLTPATSLRDGIAVTVDWARERGEGTVQP